jgi:hypothetical protein
MLVFLGGCSCLLQHLNVPVHWTLVGDSDRYGSQCFSAVHGLLEAPAHPCTGPWRHGRHRLVGQSSLLPLRLSGGPCLLQQLSVPVHLMCVGDSDSSGSQCLWRSAWPTGSASAPLAWIWAAWTAQVSRGPLFSDVTVPACCSNYVCRLHCT